MVPIFIRVCVCVCVCVCGTFSSGLILMALIAPLCPLPEATFTPNICNKRHCSMLDENKLHRKVAEIHC